MDQSAHRGVRSLLDCSRNEPDDHSRLSRLGPDNAPGGRRKKKYEIEANGVRWWILTDSSRGLSRYEQDALPLY